MLVAAGVDAAGGALLAAPSRERSGAVTAGFADPAAGPGVC